ncbi:ATP-binding protein [Rhodococcus koreensis]
MLSSPEPRGNGVPAASTEPPPLNPTELESRCRWLTSILAALPVTPESVTTPAGETTSREAADRYFADLQGPHTALMDAGYGIVPVIGASGAPKLPTDLRTPVEAAADTEHVSRYLGREVDKPLRGFYASTRDPDRHAKILDRYRLNARAGWRFGITPWLCPDLVIVDADNVDERAWFLEWFGETEESYPPTVLSGGQTGDDGRPEHHGGAHWWFLVPAGLWDWAGPNRAACFTVPHPTKIKAPTENQLADAERRGRTPPQTALSFTVMTGARHVVLPGARGSNGIYTVVGPVRPCPPKLYEAVCARVQRARRVVREEHTTDGTVRTVVTFERRARRLDTDPWNAPGDLDPLRLREDEMPWHEVFDAVGASVGTVPTGAGGCNCDQFGDAERDRVLVAHDRTMCRLGMNNVVLWSFDRFTFGADERTLPDRDRYWVRPDGTRREHAIFHKSDILSEISNNGDVTAWCRDNGIGRYGHDERDVYTFGGVTGASGAGVPPFPAGSYDPGTPNTNGHSSNGSNPAGSGSPTPTGPGPSGSTGSEPNVFDGKIREVTEFERKVAEALQNRLVTEEAGLRFAALKAREITIPDPVDLSAPPRPIRWVIDNLLPEGATALLYAYRKCGKTTLARSVVKDLIEERWVLGRFDAVKDLDVVVIDTENGTEALKRLYGGIGMPGGGRLHVYGLRGSSSLGTLDLRVPEFRKRWVECIPRGAVVLFDCLYKILGAGGMDENSSKDVGAWFAGLDEVLVATEATAIVIHHAGKDAGKGAKGNSAAEQAVSDVWRLETPDTDDPRAERWFRVIAQREEGRRSIPVLKVVTVDQDDDYTGPRWVRFETDNERAALATRGERAVFAAVRRHAGEDLVAGKLFESAGIKDKHSGPKAAAALHADGVLDCRPGPRRSKIWTLSGAAQTALTEIAEGTGDEFESPTVARVRGLIADLAPDAGDDEDTPGTGAED